MNRPLSSHAAMRLACWFLMILVSGAAAPLSARSLPAPLQVEIPSEGGVLRGELYRPEAGGPVDVVIAMHGCGGLGTATEPVLARYRDWAALLVEHGYAVLLPDSYGSRELGPQCRLRPPAIQARRERVADILAARHWLLEQPWVNRDRISLLGWANGASAVLWAVRPQLVSPLSPPDFRSAIVFYPDCRISAQLGWSARVPTLLLIGARDDVSSPAACRQVIEGAKGRSALARLQLYPTAAHDFDVPNLPLHALNESDEARPLTKGHIGTDIEARADAERRALAWLAR